MADKQIEFTTDNGEYSIREFYDQYSHNLPQWILITQGYCGDSGLDTFDAQQMLRIEMYSKQTRVVTRMNSPLPGLKGKSLSIPIDYDITFCVIGDGNHKEYVSKAQSLRDIVDKHTLPVHVQFSDTEQAVCIGGMTRQTSRFSGLELLTTFQETYLLGNCFYAGTLSTTLVTIPLYLSQLRLSLVTGIKGRSTQYWRRYAERLAGHVHDVCTFDTEYGNKDIAVYSGDFTEDTIYESLEPTRYMRLYDFLDSGSSTASSEKTTRSASSPDYQIINPPTRDYPDRRTTNTSAQAAQGYRSSKQPAPDYSGTNRSASDYRTTNQSAPEYRGTGPSDLYSELTEVLHASTTKKNDSSSSSYVVSNASTPPPPPPRSRHYQPHTDNIAHDNIGQSRSSASHLAANNPTGEHSHAANDKTEAPPTNKSDASSAPSVKGMGMAQLATWMSRLKLDKYISAFKKEMIDGEMLLELNEALLKETFKFSTVEALRLMKFARTGYLPRM